MYLRWLAQAQPRLLRPYESAYAGRVYLNGSYRQRLRDCIERLRQRDGFRPREDGEQAHASAARQRALWD
jgi:hypothetical protein